MNYIIILCILFVLIAIYFRIAVCFNIVDQPNIRSSHSVVTIRGGGIIFPFAVLLYIAFFHKIQFFLLAGVLAISLISFLDDIFSLPNKIRITVHLLSVTAMLYSVHAFYSWPLWLFPIVYILIIGAINAYNFMDGINGITGLYSLIILLSLLLVNEKSSFTDPSFIGVAILGCLVFLFFNFRQKAKCFAGDVGSISIAFWISSLLLMLILKTGELKYLLFMSVYGVDAILTIIHRLILHQNIFHAHRLHLYQIMANERGMPHLLVSILYAFVQLVVNVIVVFQGTGFLQIFLFTVFPLSLLYVILKYLWLQDRVNVSRVK